MSTRNLGSIANPRQATSVDVARMAGVSQATVSRYLNGKPVKPDMAEAIQAAIKELGYRPNHAARSLITQRTNLVAVVLGDLLNGYYGELFTTINTELAKHGLRSVIIEGRVALQSSPADVLAEVSVDGVIVATSLMERAQEELIISSGLPAVFLNRSTLEGCDTVQSENREGGRLAGEFLVRLGHKRIAMICGPRGADAIEARTEGFTEALRIGGIELPIDKIEDAGFDYSRAYEAAVRLLKSIHPPTAIFCQNDQIAVAAINAARSLSMSVPEQLSIIGFDDVSTSSWETINLTTVRQPVRRIAGMAVELLVGRLSDPAREFANVVFPCSLVTRGTVSPPGK